jgi:hypothetical protein
MMLLVNALVQGWVVVERTMAPVKPGVVNQHADKQLKAEEAKPWQVVKQGGGSGHEGVEKIQPDWTNYPVAEHHILKGLSSELFVVSFFRIEGLESVGFQHPSALGERDPRDYEPKSTLKDKVSHQHKEHGLFGRNGAMQVGKRRLPGRREGKGWEGAFSIPCKIE